MTVTAFTNIREKAGDSNYVYGMKWGAADQNALGLLNLNIDRKLFFPPQELLTDLERQDRLPFCALQSQCLPICGSGLYRCYTSKPTRC